MGVSPNRYQLAASLAVVAGIILMIDALVGGDGNGQIIGGAICLVGGALLLIGQPHRRL